MTKSIRHEAFTLIELLVVVGIIAILISLLFPALAGVRERARMMQCWNGMRQIGVWSYAFADDNNGRFPGGGSIAQGSQSWADVLNYRYANPKIQRIGQTPEKNRIYCPEMRPWGSGRWPRAYQMNWHANGGWPVDKYGLVVTNNPAWYLPGALTYYFGAKVNRVPRSQRFRKLGRRSVKRAWKEAGKTRFCAPAGCLSKFAFTADLFCCADMIYSSISVLMTVNPQEDAS